MADRAEKKSKRNQDRKISEFKLLDYNPRYTDFYDINWNEIKEKGNSKTQIQIALDLLKYEGDFTSFSTLLKSLKKGYNNDADTIISIQTKKGDLIVVEGNRRMLASRMLYDEEFSNSLLENYKNFILINKISYLDNKEEEDDQEENESMKSIMKLESLIVNLRNSPDFNISFDDYITSQIFLYKAEDLTEEEIIKINEAILSRSVSAPGGKLGWPRFQTLKNTYDIFRNQTGTLDERVDKTAGFLNRSKTSVNKELENATFIMILKKHYSSNDTLNWKALKTSAIELSINTIAINMYVPFVNLRDFLGIKWEIGDDDFEYKEKSHKTTEEIANFLIDSFFYKRNYSTRGWKKKKSKRDLIEFLGIEKYQENFFEIESSDNLSKINIVKEIRESTEDFIKLFKALETETDTRDQIKYLKSAEPEFILKFYMKRLLKQEIQILSGDIGEMDEQTYPYYSFVSMGRNVYELMWVLIFVRNEEFRNLMIEYKNYHDDFHEYMVNNTTNDWATKVYSSYKKSFDKELKFLSMNINKFINMAKNKGEFDTKIMSILRRDEFFYNNIESIETIIDNFNSNTFNRTVHRPYWLLHSEHLDDISKIVKESLSIINAFCLMLGVEK